MSAAEHCLGPLSQIPVGEGRVFYLPARQAPHPPAPAANGPDRTDLADSADLVGLAVFHLPVSDAPAAPAPAADTPDRTDTPGLVAVAVFHLRSGVLHATQAACPHRNGPLADGLIGGTTLICPLHGRKFDLATGAALTGGCGLVTFPVRVTVAGQIIVGVDPSHTDRGDGTEPL